MKYIGFFLFLSVLSGIASCDLKEYPAKELGSFDHINSNGGVSFNFVQGVENKVLSTSMSDAYYNVSGGQLSVNAPGGSMTIAIRGNIDLWCNACSVENSGTLAMDTMIMYLHAGSVKFNDVHVGALGINAINTGSYKLDGTANYMNITVVNAVSFKGYNFVTDSTYINSQNAFDVEVNATKVLNAFIYSSGNVNYMGNPPVVRVTSTGLGKAVKK
ncbi:GIN domain-containing protein [Ohtaekwangia sp.]|uniref:GIN domain-containing protein n=1 Tax=Ohtaekwangia sp. TaxID=2066019 RepID=UPI002FDE90E9